MLLKLGYKDSNLEMTESESVALPFGDTPLSVCFTHKTLLYTIQNKNQDLFLKFVEIFFAIFLVLLYTKCVWGKKEERGRRYV